MAVKPDFVRGNGEAMLFLNSSNTTYHMFSAVFDRLQKNFRVIGHNYRSLRIPHSGPFDIDVLADDALDLLEDQAPAPWTLVGSSMGGFVALNIALRRPSDVKRLVLIGTSATRSADQSALVEQAIAQLEGCDQVPEEWARWALTVCFSSDFERQHPGVVDDWVARVSQMPAAGVSEEFRCSAARRDLIDDVSRIECPVLVIHGTEDQPFSVEETKSWATRIPRAELVMLDGVGHLASVEAPDAVANLIQSFCEAHSA